MHGGADSGWGLEMNVRRRLAVFCTGSTPTFHRNNYYYRWTRGRVSPSKWLTPPLAVHQPGPLSVNRTSRRRTSGDLSMTSQRDKPSRMSVTNSAARHVLNGRQKARSTMTETRSIKENPQGQKQKQISLLARPSRQGE